MELLLLLLFSCQAPDIERGFLNLVFLRLRSWPSKWFNIEVPDATWSVRLVTDLGELLAILHGFAAVSRPVSLLG